MGDSLGKRLEGYEDLLRDLKDRVRAARMDAALAVNRELVLLYWSIGRDILERQERLGWGAKVIDQLAADLRKEFPDCKGFSGRNLKYMRSFAQTWPDAEVVQGPLAQITWWHNLALFEKVKNREQRLWYARKAVANGWSRNVLVLHVERELFEAQGGASTNKDPYKLESLGIAEDAGERVIERGLVRQIRDSLLELGQGFAFVGNQVPLRVGSDEFRVDLLFYHLKDTVAEYALRGTTQPMAVSQYELTKALPEDLKGKLPSVEDLEAELAEPNPPGEEGEEREDEL